MATEHTNRVKKYTANCTCGWFYPFWSRRATVEHAAEHHEQYCPGNGVTEVVSELD